jgi:hypothetical protein
MEIILSRLPMGLLVFWLAVASSWLACCWLACCLLTACWLAMASRLDGYCLAGFGWPPKHNDCMDNTLQNIMEKSFLHQTCVLSLW